MKSGTPTVMEIPDHTAEAGKSEHDRPPSPNQRKKDN